MLLAIIMFKDHAHLELSDKTASVKGLYNTAFLQNRYTSRNPKNFVACDASQLAFEPLAY